MKTTVWNIYDWYTCDQLMSNRSGELTGYKQSLNNIKWVSFWAVEWERARTPLRNPRPHPIPISSTDVFAVWLIPRIGTGVWCLGSGKRSSSAVRALSFRPRRSDGWRSGSVWVVCLSSPQWQALQNEWIEEIALGKGLWDRDRGYGKR